MSGSYGYGSMGRANSKVSRDDAPRRWRGPQPLCLTEGLAVQGIIGGQPHARVMPRRLRVPLLDEIQIERPNPSGKGQPELGIPFHLLGGLDIQVVGDIDLARLQHGQPRRRLRDTFKDQALHMGHFAPVVLNGLHDQLDARRMADKLIGPQPDGMLLKTVIADLLQILFRHDPGQPPWPGCHNRS